MTDEMEQTAEQTADTDLPQAESKGDTQLPAAEPTQRMEVEELVARRVVAQGLYLVDGSGLARASVQLEDGQAVQTLYDEQGRVRARVGLGPDGAPSVSLTGADGQIRAQIYLKADGEPRIGLADAHGKLRTKVYLAGDGQPAIGLADSEGRPQVLMGAVGGNATGVVVRDDAGKRRLELVVEASGGRVTLRDAAGDTVYQAPEEAPQ